MDLIDAAAALPSLPPLLPLPPLPPVPQPHAVPLALPTTSASPTASITTSSAFSTTSSAFSTANAATIIPTATAALESTAPISSTSYTPFYAIGIVAILITALLLFFYPLCSRKRKARGSDQENGWEPPQSAEKGVVVKKKMNSLSITTTQVAPLEYLQRYPSLYGMAITPSTPMLLGSPPSVCFSSPETDTLEDGGLASDVFIEPFQTSRNLMSSARSSQFVGEGSLHAELEEVVSTNSRIPSHVATISTSKLPELQAASIQEDCETASRESDVSAMVPFYQQVPKVVFKALELPETDPCIQWIEEVEEVGEVEYESESESQGFDANAVVLFHKQVPKVEFKALELPESGPSFEWIDEVEEGEKEEEQELQVTLFRFQPLTIEGPEGGSAINLDWSLDF
ncbi:hypothetical protein HDU98_011978 [Podochytrium sp. JEL0797]|nr:hypothetical protein HDU98_011978 [Podochytrium sp. JEL0797]